MTILLVHGSPCGTFDPMYPSLTSRTVRTWFPCDTPRPDVLVGAHTHVPFVRTRGRDAGRQCGHRRPALRRRPPGELGAPRPREGPGAGAHPPRRVPGGGDRPRDEADRDAEVAPPRARARRAALADEIARSDAMFETAELGQKVGKQEYGGAGDGAQGRAPRSSGPSPGGRLPGDRPLRTAWTAPGRARPRTS